MEKDFSPVFQKINALLAQKPRVLVAIDGNSGAGKTSLATKLSRFYDCNLFHMDDFFLPPELETEARLSEIGGNVDYLRLKEEVISGLQHNQPFQYRTYSCREQAFTQWVTVNPKQLNIIEGVYSLHPTLINHYDLKIFLRVEPVEQSRRILERNGPEMHRRFLNEWIPLENRYFQALAIADKCDLVFST